MNHETRNLYESLSDIHSRPEPFAVYTAAELWNDEHVSKNMLAFHLDPESAPASRPHEFIDRSAGWIARRFDLHEGRRVGDFGCGPGLYATRFAEAGARVTGFDFSRRSIEYARGEAGRRGLEIEYVLGDYLELHGDHEFDLITLIYCDLCALSPEQRARLLGLFRDRLADDGEVLLDVFTTAAYAGREESSQHERNLMHGFWAPGDYWGFQDTFKYDAEQVVLDKYTIVELERTRRIYNWLQYFSPGMLAAEFERAGLQVVEKYSNVAGDELAEGDTLAVVARRI